MPKGQSMVSPCGRQIARSSRWRARAHALPPAAVPHRHGRLHAERPGASQGWTNPIFAKFRLTTHHTRAFDSPNWTVQPNGNPGHSGASFEFPQLSTCNFTKRPCRTKPVHFDRTTCRGQDNNYSPYLTTMHTIRTRSTELSICRTRTKH